MIGLDLDSLRDSELFSKVIRETLDAAVDLKLEMISFTVFLITVIRMRRDVIKHNNKHTLI